MDLMNLGQVSRKTGLKAKRTSKRDTNGMEDLDEFFQNESGSDNDEASPNTNGTARKLSFRKSYQSPRRSTGARRSGNDLFVPESPTQNNRSSEFFKDLETLSPINATESSLQKKSADLTKKIALSKKKKRFSMNEDEPEADNGNSSPASGTKRIRRTKKLVESELSEEEPIAAVRSQAARSKSHYIEQDFGDAPDPADSSDGEQEQYEAEQDQAAQPIEEEEEEEMPVLKKSRKKKESSATSASSHATSKTAAKAKTAAGRNQIDAGPIRKSSRHRIPTLAFWRNEKIIYDTKKENGAIVREIKDVVQVPERSATGRSASTSRAASKRSRKTASPAASKGSTRKSKASSIDVAEESDEVEEMEGSEWQRSGNLSIDVFEGPGSDKKVGRTIAWSGGHERYVTKDSGADNFKVAVLFNLDKDFAAAGMLEIPRDGIKAMKNNDETYFMFHVVKGVLEVSVNDSKFITSAGCSFEVPMGNFYQLQNVGRGDARLFFVQTRYATIEPNEDWD